MIFLLKADELSILVCWAILLELVGRPVHVLLLLLLALGALRFRVHGCGGHHLKEVRVTIHQKDVIDILECALFGQLLLLQGVDGGGRHPIVCAVALQVEVLDWLQGLDVVGGGLVLRLPILLELLQQGCCGQNIRSGSTLTLRSDLHTIITDHTLGDNPITRLECPVIPLHLLYLPPQLLGRVSQFG
jgi:hypothetical protein